MNTKDKPNFQLKLIELFRNVVGIGKTKKTLTPFAARQQALHDRARTRVLAYQQGPRGSKGNRPAKRHMTDGRVHYKPWPMDQYMGGKWKGSSADHNQLTSQE